MEQRKEKISQTERDSEKSEKTQMDQRKEKISQTERDSEVQVYSERKKERQ